MDGEKAHSSPAHECTHRHCGAACRRTGEKPLTLRSRTLLREAHRPAVPVLYRPLCVSLGSDPNFCLTLSILSGRVRSIPRKLGRIWQDCDGFHREVRIPRKIGARRQPASALSGTSHDRDSRNAVQHPGKRVQVVRPLLLRRRIFTEITDLTQESIKSMTFAPDKFGEAAPGLR